MKATGIVRRIDELGRVVIPKEIRRTLRIKDGDPLEIFTDRDELMLKKYSPIATLEKFSEGTTKSLSDLSGYLAVICDTDEILFASGEGRKEFAKKHITEQLEKILQGRRSYIANLTEGGRHRAHRRGFRFQGDGADHRAHRIGRRLPRRGDSFERRRGRENGERRRQFMPPYGGYTRQSVRLSISPPRRMRGGRFCAVAAHRTANPACGYI